MAKYALQLVINRCMSEKDGTESKQSNPAY